MPYVNQRWLGGMLTNFSTVHKRLLRLKELEAMEQTGGFEGRTKKEILMLTREMTKLDRTLGGIRDMAKVPSAIWIVDTNKEHIAVGEARKLNIPVIAILDTNCDPDLVDYPIPGNDDAIRSAALLTKVVASAVAEGVQARAGPSTAATRSPKPAQASPSPSGSRSCSRRPAHRPADAPTARPRRQRLRPRRGPRRRRPPADERLPLGLIELGPGDHSGRCWPGRFRYVEPFTARARAFDRGRPRCHRVSPSARTQHLRRLAHDGELHRR